MISDFIIDYQYDYTTNRLQIKTKKVNFDLEIRKPVTIVRGGSASGKTLLVNTIKEVQNFRKNIGLSVKDNIILITNNDEFEVEDKEQLVIIDRGDFNLTETICEKIKSCKKTRFLIMSRVFYDLGVTPNYYAELTQNKDTIELQFKFSERSWFI